MPVHCQHYVILQTDFLSQNIVFHSFSFRTCSNMNGAIRFGRMNRKENAYLGWYKLFFAMGAVVVWCGVVWFGDVANNLTCCVVRSTSVVIIHYY